MEGRSEINVKPFLILYNLFLVGLSLWMTVEGFRNAWHLGYSLVCNNMVYSSQEVFGGRIADPIEFRSVVSGPLCLLFVKIPRICRYYCDGTPKEKQPSHIFAYVPSLLYAFIVVDWSKVRPLFPCHLQQICGWR
jgi:hypothetical protein